ncbi:hypothetical protein HCX50_01990 [Microbacterium oxydans]|uniref:hypothetical protein n=1 Tax=Microbacterium sp. B19(2022) TaxID=2914045 RepID=UPI001431A56D|nr:hypothetical protein [Microbacterium sp. B19(2022)]NJI58195.1 hypothetical protein [Microbacterium sp. B19(2022)]
MPDYSVFLDVDRNSIGETRTGAPGTHLSRRSRISTRGLRIDHAQPSEEPMVWIADQVLGALGEKISGGRSDWFDAVSSSTTIEQIEL